MNHVRVLLCAVLLCTSAPAQSAPLQDLQLVDLDADGQLDALLLGPDGGVSLHLGLGDGRFEDITRESNLGLLEGASCVLLADFDGDGDLDLFAGSAEQRIWLNAGNTLFEPAASGIEHEAFDWDVEALELDSDGRTDLLLRTERGDCLLRNLGDGRFERVALPWAAAPIATGSGASVVDDVTPSDDGVGLSVTARRLRRWSAARNAAASSGSSSALAAGPAIGGAANAGNLPLAGLPSLICAGTIVDQATSQCLEANSVPTLGELYPLSTNLNVSVTGNVGIGTSAPSHKLDVVGSARASGAVIAQGQLVAQASSGTAPLVVSSTTRVNNLNVELLNGLPSSAFSQLGSSIESSEIADGTITTNDVDKIFGTKITPNFGAQEIRSSSNISVLGLRTDDQANVMGGQSLNSVLNSVGCAIGGGGDGVERNICSSDWSTIGGGLGNRAGEQFFGPAPHATVGGGLRNYAVGDRATVGGGDDNEARGLASVVPGGSANLASGAHSLAAGNQSQALHAGTFVWSDSNTGVFASTGADQFLIAAAGGVGVGTNAPEGPLHVFEGSAGAVSANTSSVAVLERNANCFLQLLAPDANETGVLFGNPTDGAAAGAIVYNSTVADGFAFRAAGNSTKMVIAASGNVGIGTNAPSFLLHVDGSAGKPGGGSWSVASDARLKTNVAELDGALVKLLELRGVTYEYKDPAAIHELEGEQTGFLAQEVERVFPEWVETGADGYKRLSIRGFEALTVEALRELRSEAAERAERDAARIASLEAQMAELKALVRASLASDSAR